jgi:hypothetical protein
MTPLLLLLLWSLLASAHAANNRVLLIGDSQCEALGAIGLYGDLQARTNALLPAGVGVTWWGLCKLHPVYPIA